MVNPPRDEIRKIRAQLQQFGQVGDANVFYWFQNRKSRSKHKLRHLQKQTPPHQIPNHTPPPPPIATAPSASSSSSSSEKSSPNERKQLPLSPSTNSHVGCADDYFQGHPNQFAPEMMANTFFPSLYHHHQQGGGGFLVSDHLSNVESCTNLLLSEIMAVNGGASSKKDQPLLNFSSADDDDDDPIITTTLGHPPPSSVTSVGIAPSATIDQIQGGAGDSGGVAGRCTVIINDVVVEVNAGPFNVKEAFGDDVMLIHSSGQPVLTNEWGVTLQSLHHGASYYLVTFS